LETTESSNFATALPEILADKQLFFVVHVPTTYFLQGGLLRSFFMQKSDCCGSHQQQATSSLLEN